MMKFRTKLLAILFIAIPVTAYGATYTLVSANYPINVNGQKLAVQPLNYNGTTYLPLRSISEAVGVPIEWNNATKSVEINTVDVDKLKESCVMIFAESSSLGSQGSAVCWDYGEYLTANHIVDNGQTNIRTSESDKLTIDQTNESLDVATLDTTDDVKPVKIGDSDEVKIGDKVLLISSPERAEDTVTYATVVRIGKQITISLVSENGASGGGLFNLNGELIGILSAGNDSLEETYVTPINAIRKAF